MAINNNIKLKPEVFILIGIILFFIITNIIWLALDDITPPWWDDSGHMRTCLLYSKFMPQIKTVGDIKEIFSINNQYPPLFYISTLPIVYFFGFAEDSLVYVNFFYLILLVVSVFGIGKILFNKRVGALSALLTLLYPIMFGLSRRYLLDFALVSAVSFVQYLILRYENENKIKWNLLLFMAAAVSVLIKQTAIIFFIPTIALISIKRFNNRKTLLFLTFVFSGLILLIIRYWPIVAYQFNYYNSAGFWSGVIKRFYGNFLWYIRLIISDTILPFLLLFLIIGFISFLIYDRRRKVFLILASWIIPAFFILNLIRWKDPRYLMPFLPALSIVTIGGLNALPWKKIRNILLGIVILGGFVQFLNLSFNIPISFIKQHAHFNRPPLRQNWQVSEILGYIREHHKDRNIKIGIFPDCAYFNPNGFFLYSSYMDLPYSFEGLFWQPLPFGANLKYCDIAVTKVPFSSDYCRGMYLAKSYEDKIDKMLKEYNFKNVKNFILPDNSEAMIYEKE